MKMIKIKKGFPYFGTKVPLDRTISQIKDLLRKFGCDKIAEMDDHNTGAHVIAFTNRGRSYLIELPETVIEVGPKYKKTIEKRPDIGARVIHDRIKALLITVELDFMEFSQAMMPYLLVTGTDGRPVTLESRVGELKGEVNQLFLPLERQIKEMKDD